MSTTDGTFSTPTPTNEVVRGYAPGSAERASLQAEVNRQLGEVVEIPCVVGGEEMNHSNKSKRRPPRRPKFLRLHRRCSKNNNRD